jgi:DNA-binding response OmpR family regulator
MTRTRAAFIPCSYPTHAVLHTPAADTKHVARVLISEPHPDSRALFELVVRRAGHEPVGLGELADREPPELMILEPASGEALAIAHQLRRRLEDLPIICASIRPANRETASLRPAAYLVKPFRLAELEAALASALTPAAA